MKKSSKRCNPNKKRDWQPQDEWDGAKREKTAKRRLKERIEDLRNQPEEDDELHS